MKKFWGGIVDLVRGMVGHSLVDPVSGPGVPLMVPYFAFLIYMLLDLEVKYFFKSNDWALWLLILAMIPVYMFTGVALLKIARWCSQSEDNWLLNFLAPHHRNKLLYEATRRREIRESIRASRQKEDADQG